MGWKEAGARYEMVRRLAKKRERRTCSCEWIWLGARAVSSDTAHRERERSERTIEIDAPEAA